MKVAGKRAGQAAAFVAAVCVTGMALAADAPTEVKKLGGARITLHVHDFLTAEELTVLRLVQTSKEALALFVPSDKGFAAIALAPEEGFLKGGQPAKSAFAIADLPDAETAAAKALEGCNAAKTTATDCVIVLEVAN